MNQFQGSWIEQDRKEVIVPPFSHPSSLSVLPFLLLCYPPIYSPTFIYLPAHPSHIYPLIYSSLICLPTHSLLIIHPPITHTSIHLFFYNTPTHLQIHHITHSSVHPIIHCPTNSWTTHYLSTNCLSIYLLINHPLIYSYTYRSFICSPT